MSLGYCDSIGTYYCKPCPKSEKGRVRAMAIVEDGTPLPDPSSDQDWFNAVCSNLAIIVPESDFRGGLEIAANSATGYGNVQDQTVDFNYTLTGYARVNCENNNFWNNLNYATGKYKVWWTGESKIYESVTTVNFKIMTPIPEDLNSVVETMFEITFTIEEGNPICYDKPANIFKSCRALQDLESCLICNQVTTLPC
jgi:hypothetical protein